MPLHIPEMKVEGAPSKEQARVFHQLLGAIEAVRITMEIIVDAYGRISILPLHSIKRRLAACGY